MFRIRERQIDQCGESLILVTQRPGGPADIPPGHSLRAPQEEGCAIEVPEASALKREVVYGWPWYH